MIILILSFSLMTNAKADVSAFIDLLSSPRVLVPEVPYCAPPIDPENYFETDELKEGMKKVACVDGLEDRWFYARIHDAHCVSRFGETAFTCVEADTAKIQARMNNTPLMEKITNYTKKTFESYKGYLASECCGNKAHCLERFNSVKLKLTDTAKSEAGYESDTVARHSRNNQIYISYGKMASAYNTENIDRVIFAELGHLCQFSLLSEDETKYRQFSHPDTRCDKASGLLMFKEGLGEKLSSCLIDEVEEQIRALPEAEKGKFCFGKWYREVFSDMKFRSYYSSIYHWTYDMGRRSHYINYSSPYKSLKCAMPADWKAQLCRK